MKRYMDFDQALNEANQVRNLFYGHKKLKNLDNRIGDFPNLLKLGINHNRLKTLPDSFAKLDKLEHLDINKNYFVDLPHVLFENKSLKVLIAKHNRIKIVSPRIAEWQALEKLNLRDNLLKELPEALGQLPNLKEVILQKNEELDIAQTVEILSKLPHGLHLNLQECNIKKLPDNFVKLQNVTTLDISGNYGIDWAHTVDILTQLKGLRALYTFQGSNKDTPLPNNFVKLNYLEALHLNATENVAEVLPTFTQLKQLTLHNWNWIDNAPKTIPDWILAMKNLQYLDLDTNAFTHLPAALANLPKLRYLDIGTNHIKNIPFELTAVFLQLDTLHFRKESYLSAKKQAAFLENLRNIEPLTPALVKIAFYLYNNQQANAKKLVVDASELLPLLDIKTPHVTKHVLALLEQCIDQQLPLPLDTDSVVFLAGKATQYDAKAIKKTLKAQKIKLSTQLNDQVTHVVVSPGLKDKKDLITNHLIQYPYIQLVTGGQLQNWHTRQAPKDSFPVADAGKITDLLTSNNLANVLVALSILETHSLPTELYSDIAALYLYKGRDKKLAKTLKQLFEQRLPTLLQALVLSYAGDTYELNTANLQHIAFQYPAFSIPRFINHAFLNKKHGKEYIFENGGQYFAQVIDNLLTTENKYGETIHWLTIKFETAKVDEQIQQITQVNRLKFETFSNQAKRSLLVPKGIEKMLHLTHLHFTYWYNQQIPEQLTQLTQLKRLKLNFHKLTHIPTYISQWAHLKELELMHGNITEIPEELTRLPQLKTLNLLDNHLSEVPAFIGKMTSLQSLLLRDNQLTTLPPEIGQLSQLKSLNLSGNPITSLPAELAQLQNLTYLSILNASKALKKQVQEWLPQCEIN